MQDILQTTYDKHVIGHNGGGGTSHISYPEDGSHVGDVDTSVDKHNRHHKWETDTSVGFRQIRNDEVYVSHVATQTEEYAPTSMYSIRLRHLHRRATHIPKL
mgnify:CR=1 FL=1